MIDKEKYVGDSGATSYRPSRPNQVHWVNSKPIYNGSQKKSSWGFLTFSPCLGTLFRTVVPSGVSWQLKQAVVWKHNKPRPRVAHRGIARFLGMDRKCNQGVPWSLRTFPENFMHIGQISRFLVILLIKKQRKKERYKQRNRSKTIPRPPMYRRRGNKSRHVCSRSIRPYTNNCCSA